MRVGSVHFRVVRRLLSSRAWIAAAIGPALLASCARGESPSPGADSDAPTAIATEQPSPSCARDSSCGECDEDDACSEGLACIGHQCRPSGCRVDARRAEALIADACRCSDDCEGEAAFVQLLASSSAESDCAAPFDAWIGCELEHGACPEGIANFSGQCALELDRLTACENEGASLRCR